MLIAASLTLLGLVLGLSITYWTLWQFRLTDLDEDSQLLGAVIAEATLAAPGGVVPTVTEGYLVRASGVSAAQVYRQGEQLWEGDVLDAPDPLDPVGLQTGEGTRTVGTWRVYTLTQDGLTVQVGRRLTALRATLQPYLYVAPPLVLGLALLSGLLAWVTAGLALRPLAALTRAAYGFVQGTPGDLTGSQLTAFSREPTRPNAPGRDLLSRDEVTTLAQSFAALLGHLQRERAREQRFLAYAAHELRTPISALRAGLEVTRLQHVLPSPETCDRLYNDALRLESFAQNLLALARSDAGEVRPEPIDLADLLGAAYDRFQPLALEADRELVLEAAPAGVRADPRLLEQALNNLVANAIRHAPKGRIVLGSGVAQNRAYFAVSDPGPGLVHPPEEGLGFRVIRSVVAAHQGELEFSGGSGTQIRVWLRAVMSNEG